MPAHAVVWWIVLVALVVLLVMTGAQAVRAFRAFRRLSEQLDTLADPPILATFERAERDVGRIEAALAQFEPLAIRAAAAVAAIRRGPIPPELSAAVRLLRGELQAFQRFSRR